MKFSQKLLSALVDTEFTIIDSGQTKDSLSNRIAKEAPKKVFQITKAGPLYVKMDDASQEVVSFPCSTLSVNSTIENAFSELRNADITLITNTSDEFIGFLTYEVFSQHLFTEYQRAQAYLKTILDTIDESCTVIDQDAKVLYWTKGAEEIFSVKEKDIIGQPITNFFSPERLEILNALKYGKSVHHRQHQARKDLVVMINSKPVYLNEEIIGAVVSETDITSQILLNNELYNTSEKLFILEEEVRKASPSVNPFSYIKGNSQAIRKTLEIARKAATSDAAVLIYGESGVGKELFAKAIHNLREPENSPFVAINCGAIPSGLFESEIFGYEKGAFSGANQKGKKGKVELAKNGTLFLDEIGEMPLEMQVKILRLLQEKKFYTVGGTKEIEVDFRVVAATNRDLKELIKEGKFREDLYYRLNVVNFKVPPLRERPEDIIELTHYFLYELSVKYNRPIHGISQAVMQALLQHTWPGNIRELKNAIERLVAFSENGEIRIDDLPNEMERIPQAAADEQATLPTYQASATEQLSLQEQLQVYEKDIILKELSKVNGNKLLCAKNLEITRATLYNRMNKLGIQL